MHQLRQHEGVVLTVILSLVAPNNGAGQLLLDRPMTISFIISRSLYSLTRDSA